jgi:AraC family transcriptional regulator
MLSQLLDHGHDVRTLSLPRNAAPLHCMSVSGGYEQRRNEVYSWDGMKRGTAPFLVIQHTTLGEGRLDYAGTRHRLTPGKTMLVTMPHAHRYWLERGGEWEYFWLLLNGREALRLAREILDAAGPVLEPTPEQVDRLAGACLELLQVFDPSPGQASNLAYAAMTSLHDAVFGSRPPPESPLPAGISRVLAYIEANIGEPLPVDRLAGIAALSRAHFVRSFAGAVGAAPSDYVLEKRLERVERLLVATEMSVAAVAAATGFSDANYMAKVLRRRKGMAPLEFRAAGRRASL